MHTIKLKIDDKIYDKLIWLLGKFSKEELEIIIEEPTFSETKKYPDAKLNEIKTGNAKFLTLNEVGLLLEKSISKHEKN